MGNALVRAPSIFHKKDHARHDNGRRDSCEYGPHNSGLDAVDTEKIRREQYVSGEFAGRRQAREQDGRTANLSEVGQVERQTSLKQNDDKRHLPQLGRDRQDRVVEYIQYVRAKNNADEEHSVDTRQLDCRTDCCGSQSGKKNESK